MMNEDISNAQISKLMQEFYLTANSYHVPSQIQAEAALLIYFFICDRIEISEEQRNKFIKDAYETFKRSKFYFESPEGIQEIKK